MCRIEPEAYTFIYFLCNLSSILNKLEDLVSLVHLWEKVSIEECMESWVSRRKLKDFRPLNFLAL